MIKAIYELDMTPRRTLPIIINVSQYDDIGRTLVFNLFSSSGKWTAPTSAAVTFEGGKPDGKFFSYNCAYSNGTVTVTIQQQMTAVAGKVRCKIKVKSGDKVVESAPVIMVVDAAAVPDGSDMSKSDINDAIANATQKIVDQVKNNIPSDYTQLSTDVSSLKQDLGNIDKAVFNVFEESENINLSFTNGKYYWRDKANFAMVETETSNARYSVVSLENGQKYRYEGSYPKNTYPTLVFFDDNNIAREVLLVSTNSNGEEVTYEFIADTSIATKLSINCLSTGYTTEPKLEKLGVIKKQNKIDILENEVNSITEVHSQSKTMKMETLSDGQSILFDEKIGIRKNVTSMFYADITSFSKVYIGYTPTNANGGVKYIAIDNTNLYVYGNTGRIDETYPHELSFGENISVILDCNDNTKCKVTILTNGLIYQKEVNLIPYPLTALYCLSEGSILKNIKLSWCCKDILKDIWVFGDSYVDLYNVRWMWYLIQNGYGDNILLSGVAGSTSTDAIISFKNLLKYGKPKYAVWCMGMNDFNDTNINTPNTAWKTAYDEFLSLCKSNNILPILSTIPNVPQRTHIAKNKIVKESGYRYIDFAHAVGADEQGATWYDSLLSDDKTHPSVQGARVLYGEALASFPEFAVIN